MTVYNSELNKREIFLVFTRDFSQWVNELVRDAYVNRFPVLWGKGLEDQIVYFTGRNVKWYRYVLNNRSLLEHMVSKPLNDIIYSEKVHQDYRLGIDEIRNKIKKEPTIHSDFGLYFKDLFDLLYKVYPFYALGVFMCGPWRIPFLDHHGKDGEKVMKIIDESRKHSEGILKEVDNFCRDWLEPLMVELGSLRTYIKILTLQEIFQLTQNSILPDIKVLEKRSKGYVYFNGEIDLMSDFQKFLDKKNLFINEEKNMDVSELKGAVAYGTGKISGNVQTIFNSHEAPHFIGGSILVAPMTSVEYLPAIKQALAVVTDEGGVGCHAAIISREFKIPCIVGTKIATRVLKDGDLVEVDAEKGIVRKLDK